MDHSYYRERMSAYFDNELPLQEREVVEQHLAQCSECQNILAELKQLHRAVEKHAQLDGEKYWEKSAQRIEQRLGFARQAPVTDITPSRWKSLVPKLAAVAASIAALAFIALYEKEISRDIEVTAPDQEMPAETTGIIKAPALTDEAAGKIGEAGKPQGAGLEEQVKKDQSAERVAAAPPPDQLSEQPEIETKAGSRTAEDVLSTSPQFEPAIGQERESPIIQTQAASETKVVSEPPADEIDTTSTLIERAQRIGKKGTSGYQAAESESKMTVTAPQGQTYEFLIDSAANMGKVVSASVTPLVLPKEWQRPASLEVWRQRRDSLQALYAEVTSPRRLHSQVKSREETPSPSVGEVETLLLHTYYEVAKLTPDDEERAAAMSYLNAQAQKEDSLHKAQVEKYLQQLQQN
jgi:hypothetical protein